jgi:pteridine reductase
MPTHRPNSPFPPARQASISSSIRGDRPIALITGAAQRVGLASARALARAGFDIVMTYRSNPHRAADAARELGSLGGAVHTMSLDLDDLEGVGIVAAELAQSLPRLDVLVHNASSYDRSPRESLTGEELLAGYRVNAAAPALLSCVLAPRLAQSAQPGGGSIVALADVHALGEHGIPRRADFLAYAMSKAALVEMVRTLARELAPRIRVNALAPGVVAWPDSGHESDLAAQDAYLRSVPMARAGTLDEAAEAVRWLATDATYITGQVLRIDGGRSLV